MIISAIAAALILSAVAIGYALIYTGTENNTSSDADAKYYIVQLDADQDGTYDEATDYTDAFTGYIYYNTVNTPVGTITWTAIDTETVDGETCVKLGAVDVKVSGADDLESYDDYVLSITHESAIAGDYKIKVTVGGSATADDFNSSAGEGFEIEATGAEETIFTVELFAVVDSPTTSAPASVLYSNETFTFTATATV